VKIRNRFWFCLILLACGAGVHAQVVFHATDTVETPKQTVMMYRKKGPKPLKHEASVGFRLNSDGWSIYTDLGKIKGFDSKHSDMFHNVRIVQFEFSEKKSLAEEKTSSGSPNTLGGNNSYIYGKINNFYEFKLGWGMRKMLAGKPDPGTVAIHWVNIGGISIGLLKPYYLDLSTEASPVKYTPATAQDFLNNEEIEGSAGFSKGLSEIKVIPGVHFKSALHFDFAHARKSLIAVELGIEAEYYSQPIAIMANQTANPYFVDLFGAIQFGGKW